MLHELILPGKVLHACKTDLQDDRAECAARCCEAVCRPTVPRGEELAGDNRGGRARTHSRDEVHKAEEKHKHACVNYAAHECVGGDAHCE